MFRGRTFFLTRAGDWENAGQTYEKIAGSEVERLGDLYPQNFYMSGLIAEKQRNEALARENFSKFLDLRKDADPGLPEVEDAKKRLADMSWR